MVVQARQTCYNVPIEVECMTKILLIFLLFLQGCTVFAVADAVGSTVVYAGKTVVNTIDAITPDIVNKK